MNRCQTCKFFDPHLLAEDGSGKCQYGHIVYHDRRTCDDIPLEGVAVEGNGPVAHIAVSPFFGCIHHKKKGKR